MTTIDEGLHAVDIRQYQGEQREIEPMYCKGNHKHPKRLHTALRRRMGYCVKCKPYKERLEIHQPVAEKYVSRVFVALNTEQRGIIEEQAKARGVNAQTLIKIWAFGENCQHSKSKSVWNENKAGNVTIYLTEDENEQLDRVAAMYELSNGMILKKIIAGKLDNT